jgi:hypothetical protein
MNVGESNSTFRRNKLNNNMKHKHHIIPRHAGGTDDPNNLIELSIEEHAEAHRKLYEQYGRPEDLSAWLGLQGLVNKKEIYQILLDKRRGIPLSTEVKEKISSSLKGRKNTWAEKISKSLKGRKNTWAVGNTYATVLKGVPKTKDHKEKISKSKLGKPRPDLIGNRLAATLNGRKKSKQHQNNINASLNKPETKAKISASWANKSIVTCPHCGVDGKEGHNMNRFHFNNCKRK